MMMDKDRNKGKDQDKNNKEEALAAAKVPSCGWVMLPR